MGKRGTGPASQRSGEGGQRELEEQVLREGLCTGCGACVNLCPYQAVFHDRTVLLHPCDLAQGRCYDFCPRTPADREAIRRSLQDAADFTPDLGAVKGFFITRAADRDLRRRAQHGGSATALIALALREGAHRDRREAMQRLAELVERQRLDMEFDVRPFLIRRGAREDAQGV